VDLRLRSNEASRPAPPKDRPRYFQNTLYGRMEAGSPRTKAGLDRLPKAGLDRIRPEKPGSWPVGIRVNVGWKPVHHARRPD
jgi:hypothetical protein